MLALRYQYQCKSKFKKARKLIATAKYDAKNQSCGTLPTSAATIRKYYSYDSIGRPKETRTIVDGKNFYQNTAYDGYSRPNVVTYPSDSAGERLEVKMHYKTVGDLYKITNNKTGALLKEIKEFSRRRQTEEVLYGNNIRSYMSYRGDTGWQKSTRVKRSVSTIFFSSVNYDELGNIESRTSEYGRNPGTGSKFTESYTYDDLNRLSTRSVSVAEVGSNMPSVFDDYVDYQYDGFGNLKKKNRVNTYNYGDANRVNRLTSVSGFGSFSYDNNGNIRSDSTGRDFYYGTYDKPTRITKGDLYADMKYGVNHELYYKKEKRVEAGKTNVYQTTYLGNYEEVRRTGSSGSITEHKYYVGSDIVITHRSNNTKEYSYLHKDHQGSIVAVTNVNGTIIQQAFYEPFGKRTQIYQYSKFANAALIQPTDNGYTGHKMMDGLGIIHMNGRIYDPTLGRFLQADPFIQAKSNSQSYNRYSYVFNNPLTYTDPSGYISLGDLNPFKLHKKMMRGIASVPILNTAITIGLNFVPGCQVWCSALYTADTTYAVTGSLRAAFTSGAYSAATGYALQSIGANSYWGEAGTTQNVFANAMVGGISADLQGGKFGHGFFAAGVTAAFKPMINDIGGDNSANAAIASGDESALATYRIHRVVAAAAIGGTSSVISGGKFANGAVTGAFVQLFNGETFLSRKAAIQRAKGLIASRYGALEDQRFNNSRGEANRPLGIVLRNEGSTFEFDIYGGDAISYLHAEGNQMGCTSWFACFYDTPIPIQGADTLIIGTPSNYSSEYVEQRLLPYYQGMSNELNVNIELFTTGRHAGDEWSIKR